MLDFMEEPLRHYPLNNITNLVHVLCVIQVNEYAYKFEPLFSKISGSEIWKIIGG